MAEFIRRAIDHGLTVPRTTPGEDPACRPEDFIIVTWDTVQLSTYAEALGAVGLPCDVTGRKGPDSGADLAVLHLCLRVVADADDTVAALALLRRRNVVPSDLDTAEHYGSIASSLRRKHKLDNRSHHDLWIAATAKCHGARLLTRNPKHFQAVEGLDIIGY